MISIVSGGMEYYKDITHMMNGLIDYHQGVSTFFSNDFRESQIYERKMNLIIKDQVKIFIALEGKCQVGYLITSVNKNIGCVESLYVDENHRGKAIGDRLMEAGLEWIKSNRINQIHVSVAYGNDVLPFYEKFGLYPRSIILKTGEETYEKNNCS